MNIALVLAGGKGLRLGADIPKQYIRVNGKPVLFYTLEKFQQSPDIDYIEVVCADEYADFVRSEAQHYGITKLRWINQSGAECQDSIRNGIFQLRNECKDDDIIMVHMGVSPLLGLDTISEAVRICQEHGNALATQPCLFCLSKRVTETWTDQNAYKEDYLELNMPWTFKYGFIYQLYVNAARDQKGMSARSYAPSLMFEYGLKAYVFRCDNYNRLKITTPADLDFFEGYLLLQEQRKKEELLKGEDADPARE